MSVIYGIECDGCRFKADDLATTSSLAGSAAKTRAQAKGTGWTRVDGLDYCQECTAERAGIPYQTPARRDPNDILDDLRAAIREGK